MGTLFLIIDIIVIATFILTMKSIKVCKLDDPIDYSEIPYKRRYRKLKAPLIIKILVLLILLIPIANLFIIGFMYLKLSLEYYVILDVERTIKKLNDWWDNAPKWIKKTYNFFFKSKEW